MRKSRNTASWHAPAHNYRSLSGARSAKLFNVLPKGALISDKAHTLFETRATGAPQDVADFLIHTPPPRYNEPYLLAPLR